MSAHGRTAFLALIVTALATASGGSAFAAPAATRQLAPGALTGISGVVSAHYTQCGVVSGGGVDCWGFGGEGELGNGSFYTDVAGHGSAVPVRVEGVGGAGTLTGVSSLASNGTGFCAVLSGGGVDCWGFGNEGELGNGTFYTQGNYGSAVPVQVVGVGGTGTLTGVASLTSDRSYYGGYCAVLVGGGVDCWGNGAAGQLGNGKLYATGRHASATPVQVKDVGGTGTLSGVVSLTNDSFSGSWSDSGFCAVLASGGVDCWGSGSEGQLGNGKLYGSDGNTGSPVPVQVKGVGGTGTLAGVSSLSSAFDNYCALLTSGGVVCWGYGYDGQLGNGKRYATGTHSSTVPVQVKGAGGTGTLSGVTALTTEASASSGYCALLSNGGVDCWGYGYNGQLGDGKLYATHRHRSAYPVQVKGLGGVGTLTGAIGLAGDVLGYCAVLGSGGVDCWGYGYYGQLGNGKFYPNGNHDSAVPVQVTGVGGSGALTGVSSLTTGSDGSFCALLGGGGVDCWGEGNSGELGNGTFYTAGHDGSAVPVQVADVG